MSYFAVNLIYLYDKHNIFFNILQSHTILQRVFDGKNAKEQKAVSTSYRDLNKLSPPNSPGEGKGSISRRNERESFGL